MKRPENYLFIALSITACTSIAEKEFKDQPNILWINAEDMNPNFSCYGETIIQTPNIDSLAKVGTKFTNVHVTGPVCSASRSAIITGMYQTSIGAHNHRSSRGTEKIFLPDEIKMIPQIFQENGYFTVNAGYDYSDKTDYNFVWNPRVYDNTAKIKLNGENWNDLFKGKQKSQPWFIQLQLAGGKNRYPKIDNPVNVEDVVLPPFYPDVKEFREDHMRYLNSVINTDNIVGKIIKKLKETGEWDNTIVFFFTDHGQDNYRHKQYCYDGGTWIPLIITGPGIDKGEVRDDLISHIDISATSLYFAGIKVPDWMDGQSFYGHKYQERNYLISARDRCDWTKDRIRSVRTKDFKYIRNFHPEYAYMQSQYRDNHPEILKLKEMHRKGELDEIQDLFFQPRPAEEFYVLKDDKWEVNNQIDNSDYAQQINEMEAVLHQWIKETGDQGKIPESELSYEQANLNINTGSSCENFPIKLTIDPIFTDNEYFSDGITKINIENVSNEELEVTIKSDLPEGISITNGPDIIHIGPNESISQEIEIIADKDVKLDDLSMLKFYATTIFPLNKNSNGYFDYQINFKPTLCYEIKQKQNEISIDGDLSDWKEQFIRFENTEGTTQCDFITNYDDENIYVAVKVSDDEIISKKGIYCWLQDGIEIRLDARPDPVRSNNIGTLEFLDHLLVASSPSKSGIPNSIYKAGIISKSPCPEQFGENGIQYSHKIVKDGHILEASFPINIINKWSDGDWKAIRLNIIVHDKDNDKSSHFSWYPDWRNKEKNIIGSGTFIKK